jgi:AcrR family transcriptional regulator
VGTVEAPLRLTKKQKTHGRILANAVALFRRQGIRGSRMSEIARESEVSPATLFNYFPTKGQLAEAWVRGEVESTLVGAAEASLDGGRSLRSAIRGACRVLASATAQEPQLRFEAWREAGRAAGQPALDRAPLLQVLKGEQQRERVRGDLGREDLADLLVDAIESGLIAGLSGVGGHISDDFEAKLSEKIRQRIDLVLDGARKRNERVRVASKGSRG